MRLDHVSNTRLYDVRGLETGTGIYATSFDGSQCRGSQPSTSTSWIRMSQASTSRETHATYQANQEELVIDVGVPVDSYLGGTFDTFLLHIYGDHVARRVLEWERYLFTFALHLFYINLIVVCGDMLIFTITSMFKIRKPHKEDFGIGTTRRWLV